MRSNKVTVYSIPGCPNCIFIIAMLQKYGVDVEEVNIVKDARAKNFLARVGKLTVPKVYINNVLFATYDELATMNKDETLVKMELLKRMVN